MNVMDSIQAKLDAARAELLDLGLTQPARSTTNCSRREGLRLSMNLPPDIYRILVQDGKNYVFPAKG